MTRFGIGLTNTLPIPETVKLIQTAEEAGFEMVALVDSIPYQYYQDIFVTMSMALQATKKIKVASGICIPYTRHPAMLAAGFNSLDQLFPGRLVLGLGPGGFLPLNAMGIPLWNKPLTAMRESFSMIRSLFKGETVTMEGKVFKANNVVLTPHPKEPIPLWLAARGPKMTQLVGEISDGSFCTGPYPYLDHQIELIKQGAKKADRSIDDIVLGNWLISAIDEDPSVADKLATHDLTYMVPATPEYVHKRIGSNLEDVKKLQEVAYRSLDEAEAFVTPFMLDNWAIRGTAEDVNKCVDRQIKAGIEFVVFGGPFAKDPIAGIKELGKTVISSHT